MNVIHSCQAWLPATQNWIHTQVVHLPSEFRSTVVCRALQQPELFPVAALQRIPDTILGGVPALQRAWGLGATLRAGGRIREELTLARVSRSRRAAVIHSHFGPVGWRDSIAASLAGIGHVVTFYGVDVVQLPRTHPRWRRRYRSMFTRTDLVLCEGEHMASEIRALGCPGSKVRVQRLGIELGRYVFGTRSRGPDEPYRILMAASFREKKGYEYGIAALGKLRDRVRFELTIVGDGNAAARQRIQEAIQAAGIGERVRLRGFLAHAELAREASRNHLFLSPNVTAIDGDTEGGAPVSIIEMMASGMPVVATRHCDIPNVVVDGATGYLAAERDIDDLAAQLDRMFRDEHRWGDMGAAARARVVAEFDANKQGARLGALYREALEGRARRG